MPIAVERPMPNSMDRTFEEVGAVARELAERSYAPYSNRRVGCVALLSDGTFVPGVRVENASFPLLISAMLNALTTAVAEGRTDFVAFVSSRPITHVERDLIEPFLSDPFVEGHIARSANEALPALGGMLDPIHRLNIREHRDGVGLAREVAQAAWVPESNFQVGCVVGSSDGGYVKGVNVEHPDWNLGLCAERTAIGTAVTFGLQAAETMYLTCLKDPAGTPCGACRQVLVEFDESLELVMDRHHEQPEVTTPAGLLPDFFGGSALRG